MNSSYEDATVKAQGNQEERCQNCENFSHYLNLENMASGTEVCYHGSSNYQQETTVTDFVITLVIDFPHGVDIDKEQ
jgi:hypothetical protein